MSKTMEHFATNSRVRHQKELRFEAFHHGFRARGQVHRDRKSIMGINQAIKRLLKVALVGAPNVGKSTLLNKLVCSEISCVSNKVHTTRRNILGVYTQDLIQLEFYDSPGLVNREHLLKHRLENSLIEDPEDAAHKCDMIVVVVDASNIREKKRLNQGLIKILQAHQDKKSILVLNKVDLIKEKRQLLDISTRLSQGCLENRLRFNKYDLKKMTLKELQELNLQAHVPGMLDFKDNSQSLSKERPQHQYVIELKKPGDKKSTSDSSKPAISPPTFHPDMISYRNFSEIFSVSALREEGVVKLREYLLSQAQPVAEWPHGPNYLSNQTLRDLVHAVIRGRVMDEAKHAAPYTIGYKYLRCDYDGLGSLHIYLSLQCPERYMIPMMIGKHGEVIGKIIDDARKSISRTLACEVKLDIQIEHAPGMRKLLKYQEPKTPSYQTRDSTTNLDADSDLELLNISR